MSRPPLVIATLVIGEDYRATLKECLDSKREYARSQGYIYVQGDEKFWDRRRPISWSKLPFFLSILETLPEGAFLWASDADVYITNPSVDFYSHVLSLLPPEKDVLITFDGCGHINGGNIVYRNTKWTRDWIRHIDAMSQDLQIQNHIWWETGAMDRDIKGNIETQKKVEISLIGAKRFNAYCMGFEQKNQYVYTAIEELSPFIPDCIQNISSMLGTEGYPDAVMWRPGDLLIHFAGIYDAEHMARLIERIKKGETPRLNMYNPRETLS